MKPKCIRCGQKSQKTPRAPLTIMKILDFSCYSISLKINSKTNIIVCKISYRSDILYQPLLDICQKKVTSLSLQPVCPPMTISLNRQLAQSSVEIQSQEKAFQNLSFRPRNLLPSGLLEGVERDEQSGSPGPTL